MAGKANNSFLKLQTLSSQGISFSELTLWSPALSKKTTSADADVYFAVDSFVQGHFLYEKLHLKLVPRSPDSLEETHQINQSIFWIILSEFKWKEKRASFLR